MKHEWTEKIRFCCLAFLLKSPKKLNCLHIKTQQHNPKKQQQLFYERSSFDIIHFRNTLHKNHFYKCMISTVQDECNWCILWKQQKYFLMILVNCQITQSKFYYIPLHYMPTLSVNNSCFYLLLSATLCTASKHQMVSVATQHRQLLW